MKKRFTTTETADLLELCPQRIAAKLKQGHFPNHAICECSRTILIPLPDIVNDIKKRKDDTGILDRMKIKLKNLG